MIVFQNLTAQFNEDSMLLTEYSQIRQIKEDAKAKWNEIQQQHNKAMWMLLDLTEKEINFITRDGITTKE